MNPIQEAVVEELKQLGAGICVVGDDDQTIYQWRGSSVQGILTFEKRYPAVATYTFPSESRARPVILSPLEPPK